MLRTSRCKLLNVAGGTRGCLSLRPRETPWCEDCLQGNGRQDPGPAKNGNRI
jgi:hypothetical protein